MVTATFYELPEGFLFRDDGISYEFAAPVPEPSTLFLISACVPLLWLWRRAVRLG
jgi:hypothetical protein